VSCKTPFTPDGLDALDASLVTARPRLCAFIKPPQILWPDIFASSGKSMGYTPGLEPPITPDEPDVPDAGDVVYDPLAAGLEGVPGCSQLVDLLRKLPIRHPHDPTAVILWKGWGRWLGCGFVECVGLERGFWRKVLTI